MVLAIIYCAGFVTLFYAFMRYYVSDRYDGFDADGLGDAVALAFLMATIWPVVLIIMVFTWIGPRIGL